MINLEQNAFESILERGIMPERFETVITGLVFLMTC